MDYYHVFVNLRDTRKDVQFARDVDAYMNHLKADGRIEGYTLARRKLGFGPGSLGEFHITIRTKDLAQLEQAFQHVATRDGEVEKLHRRVYGAVTDFTSLLDRDFPDAVRKK